MDKVVHFEIPADDLARAKQFYGTIFGWQLQDMPMPGGRTYTSVRTVPVDDRQLPKEPGAINGGMMQRSKDVRSPVIAINVSSVEAYLKKIVAAGGKIVTPTTTIAGMGYYAYAADTEGNVIGLWQDLKPA